MSGRQINLKISCFTHEIVCIKVKCLISSLYFTLFVGRLFLERREEEIQHLLAQFSATNMMDEKTELVVQFLNRMWAGLEQEPMFAATNDEQRAEAR